MLSIPQRSGAHLESGITRVGPENSSGLILLRFLQRCGILIFMMRLLGFLVSLLTSTLRTRASLQAEIAALRHQLAVYQGKAVRPSIAPADRLLWAVISRLWSDWRTALYFVQPRTVTDWQKKRFRDYWRKLSRPSNPGRPRISTELRELIRRMWRANPTWGSPRIVGELRKLGISVAKSSVERYRPQSDGPLSVSWKTFLDLHIKDLASIDFFCRADSEIQASVCFYCRQPRPATDPALQRNGTSHRPMDGTAVVGSFPVRHRPAVASTRW